MDYEQGKKLSEAIVHIEMKNTTVDSFFINRDFKIENVIVPADTVDGVKNLSGAFGFPIPEGNYSLLVKAWDANNEKLSKTINEKLQLLPYANDKFSISDKASCINVP